MALRWSGLRLRNLLADRTLINLVGSHWEQIPVTWVFSKTVGGSHSADFCLVLSISGDDGDIVVWIFYG